MFQIPRPPRTAAQAVPPGVNPDFCELEEDYVDPYSFDDIFRAILEGREIARGERMRLGIALADPHPAPTSAADVRTRPVPSGTTVGARGFTSAGTVAIDARILPSILRPSGERRRGWKDACDSCEEVQVAWKVTGPRTTMWCLGFLSRRETDPTQHHERFKTNFGLTAQDWGVTEHYHVMKEVKAGLEEDQLDLPNLKVFELSLRRAQMYEHFWHDDYRVRAAESHAQQGKKGGLSVEEVDIFLGERLDEKTVMVCPRLVDHLATELAKEANIKKNERKAREERAARRGR